MRPLLASLFLFLSFTFVFAETEAELRSKVDSMNSEIQALAKEIANYASQVSKTQGDAKTLKEAVTKLENQKKILEKQVSYTSLQVNKTKEDIHITENSISDMNDTIQKQKNAIREIINRVKQDDSKFSGLLSLLNVKKSLSDSLDYLFQSNRVNTELGARISNLNNSKQDLENTKVIYQQKNKDLNNLKKILTGQKEIIVQTTEQKNILLKETKNKEVEYQKLLQEKQARKLALEKESADFEAKLKVIVDASKIPKGGTGALAYPVAHVVITQYFGNTPFATANSQVYNGRGHNGIDFGIPIGTKILAAQDGVVLGTGNTDTACSGASYGKWVFIRHPNGLSSLYAHLSSFIAKAGDTVKKGDVIALSGNTGYSTGPHLHFTVYASDAVHITGPTEYKSKACGTYIIMPVSPIGGYLNPLTFF